MMSPQNLVKFGVGAIALLILGALLFNALNSRPPVEAVAAPTHTPVPTTTVFIPVTMTTPPTTTPTPTPTRAIARYTYTVVATYPHDPTAFTQGLIYHQGEFYEGTGLRGESSLRRVEIETGEVLQQHNLADEYFGEGITLFGERLIQLTWTANLGFVYDKSSFEQQDTFTYTTEGWGLTHNGDHLIMSDGTANLYFRDPVTFEEIDRVQVTLNGEPITQLNELEYINGEVYANVWRTNFIVRIDPATGDLTGLIDLAGLLKLDDDYTAPVDVLNGIAYNPGADQLFVTGKLWPFLYEIELVPLPAN